MNTDQMAQLAFDNYYKTEVTSPNTIQTYIDGGDYDRHSSTEENLIDALYDDIRDLLHNGNQEDLFGDTPEADDIAQQLHDGWNSDPDPLEQLCRALATLMMAHATTGPKED